MGEILEGLQVDVVVKLAGVSKSIGGRMILRPTTLDVGAKTTLAIIGSSGCGKSTLLRLIVGLIAPDAGTIQVAGERMTPESATALRMRIGYVIQDGGLFPHLTARDNVTLVARHYKRTRETIDARVEELTALTRLDAALLARFPSELSGGQRQRVGIMRALMLDPAVLLLDEPLGALDPIVRAQLQEDLATIFRRLEKTVLLVTHDLSEAAILADEVAVMNDGEIVQRGAFRDVVAKPASDFVARFVAAQRSAAWSGA